MKKAKDKDYTFPDRSKGEVSELKPFTPVKDELLDITDEQLEDLAEGNAIMHLIVDEEETHSAARKTGFKDGYVEGYKKAISHTVGKGYNPAAMDELYKALKRAKQEIITLTDADQPANKVHYPKYIDTALQNAKTIKP